MKKTFHTFRIFTFSCNDNDEGFLPEHSIILHCTPQCILCFVCLPESLIGGSVSPQYDESSCCGWKTASPDMEDYCEYAIADSRQRVTFRRVCRKSGHNSLP
jgi:hypothetical protein